MAVFAGKAGVVQLGSNDFAEVRSYSITETADTTESTTLGNNSKTYVATLTDFSGTVECFFDDTDSTAQVAATVGSSITLNLGPEGSGSGAYKLTGTAIITNKEISASQDGLVELTIEFQGTGGLTISTY
jgi:predicted secreted protein